MIRTPLSSRCFGLAAVSLLVACAGSVDPGHGHGTLIVRADVSASAVATLVAEVTAADIPIPLIFNIPISGGVASGTITIPAASAPAFTLAGPGARRGVAPSRPRAAPRSAPATAPPAPK